MKTTPETFAIVTDGQRRGGLRVCRVTVETVLTACAFVEERAGKRLPHCVHFSRLCSGKRRADLPGKLKAALAEHEEKVSRVAATPAEEPLSHAMAGAGQDATATREALAWMKRADLA